MRRAAARWDIRMRCFAFKRFRRWRVTFLWKAARKSNQKKAAFPDQG
jgi:hypothetical protein